MVKPHQTDGGPANNKKKTNPNINLLILFSCHEISTITSYRD